MRSLSKLPDRAVMLPLQRSAMPMNIILADSRAAGNPFLEVFATRYKTVAVPEFPRGELIVPHPSL